MICITCGKELIAQINYDVILGYECVNPDCSEYNKPWTLAEHKDNQTWAVRHIRALEDQLKKQQDQINLLVKKLEGI